MGWVQIWTFKAQNQSIFYVYNVIYQVMHIINYIKNIRNSIKHNVSLKMI